MPYKKIRFIKLFLDLFDSDDRFLYQLNESQQLLYIKLLYLSGLTENKIPKLFSFVQNKINFAQDEACFLSDISRINIVFPKFQISGKFYRFKDFEKLHNYVFGNSQGTPKELPGFAQNKKKNKKENKNKKVQEPEDRKCFAQASEFFSYYSKSIEQRFNQTYKLTPPRKNLILKKLKEGRSLEELKLAVDNFVKDDWADRKKYLDLVYCIGNRNQIDQVDKWVNYKSKKPKYMLTTN